MTLTVERWAERQKAALIDAGIDPIEAQRSVQWVIDNLPDGEDPASWVPEPSQLEVNLATPETISDARTAWYVNDAVPTRYKLLLDAEVTDA